MNRPPIENFSSARSRLPWVLAGAVIAALAVLAAAIVYALNRGEDVTARWETAGTMTSNPWTPSIVKPGAPVTVPGDFVGTATVTSVAGDDCDKEALKRHLGSDPRLAENWARVLGITAGEISGYIDRLQSRRLTVPVQVTNHDYEGDSPRELQSVLDVGTAVLTDADGTPRVRCACGNPLKPAAVKATKFDNLPPGAELGAVVTDPVATSNNGTAIRVIGRPLVTTATGTQPAPGYTVKDYSFMRPGCLTSGPTPYGKSTAACTIGDSTSFCWPDTSYVYCLAFATGTELSRYGVSEWQIDNGYNDPTRPATVELSNGYSCRPGSYLGTPPTDRARATFSCRTGGDSDLGGQPVPKYQYVWGEIDRSKPTWTATVSEPTDPPVTAEVRVAYYAVDSDPAAFTTSSTTTPTATSTTLSSRASTSTSSSTSVTDVPRAPTATIDGYGSIKLGMTEQQVKALPEASLLVSLPSHPGCRALSAFTDGPRHELTPWIKIATGTVSGIDTPRGTKTDRDVGDGSTPAQIRAAYSNDHDIRDVQIQIGMQKVPAIEVRPKSSTDVRLFIGFPIENGISSGPPSIGRHYAAQSC